MVLQITLNSSFVNLTDLIGRFSSQQLADSSIHSEWLKMSQAQQYQSLSMRATDADYCKLKSLLGIRTDGYL